MLPTRTQISLRIRAVWSESSLSVWTSWKLCILGYPKCGWWRFWLDRANAQANLNLRWVHMSGTFSDVEARFYYRIRPNYRIVRSCFSKLLRTLICGKICIYLLRIHYKKDQKRTYLMMTMPFFLIFLYKGICCGYSFELHRQVDAIQMSTHNISLYKEVNKRYYWLPSEDYEISWLCAYRGKCGN